MVSMKLPVLFLAHGSPMLAIEQTPYAIFLGELAAQLPRPKAVVLFTAHCVPGYKSEK
jgi:4,5-DOPA dioxygenase extradiol